MKVAVLISNMGGPDSLQEVEPFLFQIFNDPHIIDIALPGTLRRMLAKFIARKRVAESVEIYRKLGGKTPLHAIMRQQAETLQANLNMQNDIEFTVWPANRYSQPSLEGVLSNIHSNGYDRIVVLSMYPFYASSTSGSIKTELKRLRDKLSIPPEKLLYIDRYGYEPAFIRAMAEQIREQIGVKKPGDGRKVHLLLSAHSIPERHVKKGDPYFDQVSQAVQRLRTELPDWWAIHLAFQSKIGPVKWLAPSTEEKIIQLAKEGVKELYVYPLGFVADNSETVYEIGMLYHDLARENGMERFIRIDALNARPAFISALKKVVLEHLVKKE